MMVQKCYYQLLKHFSQVQITNDDNLELGLRQKVHCLYKSLTTILIFNLIGVGVGFQKEFLLSQYKGKMMK